MSSKQNRGYVKVVGGKKENNRWENNEHSIKVVTSCSFSGGMGPPCGSDSG